ncbi:MAG: LysM peptidoglycan-binding domain-containing protein [Planctomycetaceae bacterium]|nr:LysM peptidoglycan-binding domain-containing protein [Planctomycetaceae bacterium]
MTTDAKIGLLLALVFIVAITFVINGLPDFLSKKDKPDLTGAYIGHYSKPEEPGIIDRSSREAAALLNKKTIVSAPVSEPVAETNTTQSGENYQQAIIPAASEAVKNVAPQTTVPQQPVTTDVQTAASAAVESVKNDTAAVAKVDGKTYEVAEGDSLVSIAQKFYGPKAGSKYANIQNIYEANKNTMKTRDSLQIGQKLIIPKLSDKEQELVNTGLFEKTTETPKTAAAAKKTETTKADAKKTEDAAAKDSKALKDYVVKENDTLWKLAVKYLGDGNRYDEIAQLNKTINPDHLVVGTKIKLPAK